MKNALRHSLVLSAACLTLASLTPACAIDASALIKTGAAAKGANDKAKGASDATAKNDGDNGANGAADDSKKDATSKKSSSSSTNAKKGK